MESQSLSNKEDVLVVVETNMDFIRYQQENPSYNCIMVTDGIIFRGREYCKIAYVGDYMQRWNWQDIAESIERFEEQHANKLDMPDSLDEQQIDYGGFN